MSLKGAKVVSLSQVRALRDTLDALHSPDTKAVILAGATSEFKRLVAPVLRELLASKNAPAAFQRDLIALLEKVYAAQHIDSDQTQAMLNNVQEFIDRMVSS